MVVEKRRQQEEKTHTHILFSKWKQHSRQRVTRCSTLHVIRFFSAYTFIASMNGSDNVVEDKCCSRKSFCRLNYGFKHLSTAAIRQRTKKTWFADAV